jgi:GrpB-like predicted nucleotidyltransferase (UPF0157 family)
MLTKTSQPTLSVLIRGGDNDQREAHRRWASGISLRTSSSLRVWSTRKAVESRNLLAAALSQKESKNDMGLIGGLEQRTIEIVNYDPLWPEKFQTHASAITTALGDTALLIEHIGSTSVPGLAAKPIIDILVVVANSADEASYLPQIEAAGYELRVREPDFQEHRMFRTPARDVHVHFYSSGSPEIERYLTFRDRLRNNGAERQLYEEVKRKLAALSWPHMDAYAEAKTEVIAGIIARAHQAGTESN